MGFIKKFAPSRVRGLKPVNATSPHQRRVRTFTGAWIETKLLMITLILQLVRTFTGAWIETLYRCISLGF